MTDPDLIFLLLRSAALGISVFALLAILLRRAASTGPAVHLDAMAVFLAVNSLDLVDSLAFEYPFAAPLWLYGWADAVLPLFMISLWFFVRGLTEPALQLGRRDLWHLLPLALAVALLMPFLTLPPAVRAALYVDSDLSNSPVFWAEFGVLGFWAEWILILIGYGLACARRLAQHKRTIRTLFSDLSGKSLWWLDALVATILLLTWIIIVDEFLLLLGADGIMTEASDRIYEIYLSCAMGLIAILAKPPLPAWSATVVDTPEPTAATVPHDTTSPQKYARSGLTSQDLTRLADRLHTAMTKDKLWQDPTLNLQTLAQAAAIPTMHLSEALNTHIGKNFFEYVNDHRISAACQLLAESQATILEISDTVGYNSKSTFNSNFKRLTDKTPSQWRKAAQAARAVGQAAPNFR